MGAVGDAFSNVGKAIGSAAKAAAGGIGHAFGGGGGGDPSLKYAEDVLTKPEKAKELASGAQSAIEISAAVGAVAGLGALLDRPSEDPAVPSPPAGVPAGLVQGEKSPNPVLDPIGQKIEELGEWIRKQNPSIGGLPGAPSIDMPDFSWLYDWIPGLGGGSPDSPVPKVETPAPAGGGFDFGEWLKGLKLPSGGSLPAWMGNINLPAINFPEFKMPDFSGIFDNIKDLIAKIPGPSSPAPAPSPAPVPESKPAGLDPMAILGLLPFLKPESPAPAAAATPTPDAVQSPPVVSAESAAEASAIPRTWLLLALLAGLVLLLLVWKSRRKS